MLRIMLFTTTYYFTNLKTQSHVHVVDSTGQIKALNQFFFLETRKATARSWSLLGMDSHAQPHNTTASKQQRSHKHTPTYTLINPHAATNDQKTNCHIWQYGEYTSLHFYDGTTTWLQVFRNKNFQIDW